jgi:hypothetical protein
MSARLGFAEQASIVVEGAVDRICGRPVRAREPVQPGRPRGVARMAPLARGGRVSRVRGMAPMGKSDLPDFVPAEVRRVLDGAARRLLAAQLHGDPIASAARGDTGLVDDRADKSALLVEGEPVPGATSGDRHSGRRRRL